VAREVLPAGSAGRGDAIHGSPERKRVRGDPSRIRGRTGSNHGVCRPAEQSDSHWETELYEYVSYLCVIFSTILHLISSLTMDRLKQRC
jgi:hypothetical protein